MQVNEVFLLNNLEYELASEGLWKTHAVENISIDNGYIQLSNVEPVTNILKERLQDNSWTSPNVEREDFKAERFGYAYQSRRGQSAIKQPDVPWHRT